MTLKDLMDCRTWVVAGDTLNSEKYAYKIKHGLIGAGYSVFSVGKELDSISAVPVAFDVLDLCIHPAKGLKLLEDYEGEIPAVLIQPGAESDEIRALLERRSIPYIEGCALVGLSLYHKS